ncbi:MAG: response regulator [Planctomycetota bacterium]|jgi:two-component system chemotaxis response regulator CheY
MSLNILVVDDSSIVRAVIIKTLKLAKIPFGEIHEAENGAVALEKLDTEWIDLVFADINMPVMNGIEMVEKIRSPESDFSTVPVIIVSTEGSEVRIEQLKNKGVNDYIRKPFTPEEVREAVLKITGEVKDG